jgi:membrane protein implicated in regulation of membrane protease activity
MDTLFLACFVVGALFTLASLVVGHAHVGHVHLGHHAPHVHGHLQPGQSSEGVPWLNASSAVGALTWFGAAGYLLLRLGDWAVPAVLLGALLAGAIGWYLVARFLGLVLAGESEMDPADYRLEGTVGRITVRIPAGGTGEVVFSKASARRSEAARALDGSAIPRGTEVVITGYADGFATVQPWAEFIAARDDRVADEQAQQHQRGLRKA